MRRMLNMLVSLALAASITACATAGGAMMGAGISRATGGDATTGALIGGGIGMMVDFMN